LRACAVVAPDVEPGWLPIGVVRDLEGSFREAYGADGSCAFLVRPDGYIAYRQRPLEADGVVRALSRVLR
jgi:pentachlorophenol monooxygenase